MVVQIVSVPFDLCGPHHGSRLGSLAMQMEGLAPGLVKLGHTVTETGVAQPHGNKPGTRPECDAEALGVYQRTSTAVAVAIGDQKVPLVIGGDHSIAIGSISGAIAACGDDLAVLWIDAHMDFNTPDTTPSGNLHGVPLAVLLGLPAKGSPVDHDRLKKPWIDHVFALWQKLLEIVPEPGLSPARTAWVGLRDVDQGEIEHFNALDGALALTMQEVDELGIAGAVAQIDEWMRKSGAKHLWISFDVDVLDPIYAPGTGTAVRGGLTYREGHQLAESLCRLLAKGDCALAGLDVVEVNPLQDRSNETARVATEWVLSLFGKTILGLDTTP